MYESKKIRSLYLFDDALKRNWFGYRKAHQKRILEKKEGNQFDPENGFS